MTAYAHLDKAGRFIVCGFECGERFGKPASLRRELGQQASHMAYVGRGSWVRDGGVWTREPHAVSQRVRRKYGDYHPDQANATGWIDLPAKVRCARCQREQGVDALRLESTRKRYAVVDSRG